MCVLAAARFTSFLLVSVLFQAVPASSAEVNYTIDDQLGDSVTGALPAYLPSGGWAQGNQCTGCGIHPGTGGVDVSQVFDGTWHDSTYHPGQPERTISVSFTGTAVYVFNLIANNFGQVTTFTNLTFFIDNALVGQYTHAPDNTSTILYRVPVYTNTSLSNSEHFLTMVADGPNASIILFDFIVYTADNETDSSSSNSSSASSNTVSTILSSLSSPSSSGTSSVQSSSSSRKSSTPVGAIVGGAVGGVCALIIIATACLCICRGRTSRSPSLPGRVDPFIANPTSEVSPGQLATRRFSRASMLQAVKLGRTRHTPETGLSTSASSGIPDPHRPSLHPPSVAGTDRSQLHAELARRIQALEAQMRTLDAEQRQPGSSTSGSSGRGTQRSGQSSRPSRGSRARSRSAGSSGLRSNLSALRNEIAELRAELENDQRLLAEAAPPYVG